MFVGGSGFVQSRCRTRLWPGKNANPGYVCLPVAEETSISLTRVNFGDLFSTTRDSLLLAESLSALGRNTMSLTDGVSRSSKYTVCGKSSTMFIEPACALEMMLA